jgi:UDP-N-acetylmuramyl tripeptide synthase
MEDGLVVVTGSAGKSTTTKMFVAVARAHGKRVFTNPSTANILQGFYSSIIEKSDWRGRLDAQVAILEMDEGHAELLTRKVKPRQVTVLNVMEDQLDRFVDPALVRETLAKVASRAEQATVLNTDDQNMLLLADSVALQNPSWFGVGATLLNKERHGLGTAPTYLPALPRRQVATEVVVVGESHLKIIDGSADYDLELPNRGIHFVVDAAAAYESARRYLGSSFDGGLAAKTISNLPPVFARGEVTHVGGEEVEFILVQNPGSMQLNIDNLTTKPEQILFAIGRDVHDPSWLWTVDYASLTHADVVAGFNAAEAALVLAYNDVPVGKVIYDLDEALQEFFALPVPSRGRKTVIFSADAMRRIRRTLGFWSPEEVGQ